MSDIYKSSDRLRLELGEMKQKLDALERCRHEFERAQARYHKLMEAAPDAMVFVNADYNIVMVNAQTERLFGYESGDLPGKKLETLIPERFRKRHSDHISGYFSNPRVRTMGSDLRIFALRKDGSEFRVDISLSPLRTDEGLLVTAAIRDITERIEAQEQIERNFHIQRVISAMLKMSLEPVSLETKLDLTLELILSVPHISMQSMGSIYLAEGDPRTLVLKAQRGFTKDELSKCSRLQIGKCLCGQSAASCQIHFEDCVEEEHNIRFHEESPVGHYCVPIISGERELGLVNVFVREGHTRIPAEEEFLLAVANTLASLIERHRAEEEKRRLQEQLNQSEKLAALGRISANIAHELRNPLTSIGGFARRLQSGLKDDTSEKEYAGFIVSEVLNLEKTLKDVLEYSRVTVPHLEIHKVGVILQQTVDTYSELFKEHGITVRAATVDVPEIMMDKELVIEAVGNLLSNAVDAMPDGGEIGISVSIESSDSRRFVAISVSDSGEGISEDVLDKIFEPFYTTKISKRGVGLGLPITKKITEDHGGFVSVNSTMGKGTTFILHFPLGERYGANE